MHDVQRELDRSLVDLVVNAIWDKKGFDVRAYDVREVLDYTDCMVICSASSDRQAAAIARHVVEEIRVAAGFKPVSSEGVREGKWALIDFGDVVAHVFHRPVRDYYELDRLYGDAPQLPLEAPEWDRDSNMSWASADDWSEKPLAAGHDVASGSAE